MEMQTLETEDEIRRIENALELESILLRMEKRYLRYQHSVILGFEKREYKEGEKGYQIIVAQSSECASEISDKVREEGNCPNLMATHWIGEMY